MIENDECGEFVSENGVYMRVKGISYEQESTVFGCDSGNGPCGLEGTQVCLGNTVGSENTFDLGSIDDLEMVGDLEKIGDLGRVGNLESILSQV